MKIFHAWEIAEHFMRKGDVSRPKLDRLLYYAQGFFLAHQGEELFSEEIIADPLGVLVKHLNLREDSEELHRLPPEVVEILDAVYCLYGRLAPRKVVRLIRKSPPHRLSQGGAISPESMSSYFKEIVRAGKEGHSYEHEPVWPANSFRHQQRREISRRMEKHRDWLREIASRMPADVDPWGEEDGVDLPD